MHLHPPVDVIELFPRAASPEVIKEIPIRAHSGAVERILKGQITQFRFPITEAFSSQVCKGVGRMTYDNKILRSCAWFEERDPRANGPQQIFVKCPFGQSGDRLWVCEPWGYDSAGQIVYKASAPPDCTVKWSNRKLRKEHARIWLNIDWIRVERLCLISKADCRAMGISGEDRYLIRRCRRFWNNLWAPLYGPKCWELHTWVWVFEFSVLSSTVKLPDPLPPPVPAAKASPAIQGGLF